MYDFGNTEKRENKGVNTSIMQKNKAEIELREKMLKKIMDFIKNRKNNIKNEKTNTKKLMLLILNRK